jgi:hypothetical protein
MSMAQVWLQRAGGKVQVSPWCGGSAASSTFLRIPRDLLE